MSFLRSIWKKPNEVSLFPAFDEFEKYYHFQDGVFKTVLNGNDPKTGKTVSDVMQMLVSKLTDVTTAEIPADKVSPFQVKLSTIKERVNKFCIEAILNISNANGVNEVNITAIETSSKEFNDLCKKVGVQGCELSTQKHVSNDFKRLS
jgi:hypothetical protein